MANKRPGVAGRGNKATTRQTRVPVAQQDKLKYDQREGFARRVVNDVDDGQNVKMYEAAGWTKVTAPNQDLREDSGGESQMGTEVRRSVGGGRSAVLMEIPEKLFKADQKLKQDNIDKNERGLVRNKKDGIDEDSGAYGEVTIKR